MDDNLLVILGASGMGAAVGIVAAFLASEVVRNEGLAGVYRWLHWKLSSTERYRRPYRG